MLFGQIEKIVIAVAGYGAAFVVRSYSSWIAGLVPDLDVSGV